MTTFPCLTRLEDCLLNDNHMRVTWDTELASKDYNPANLPAIVRKVRWQWRFDWDVMHYRLECNVKTGFKGNVRYKHYYSNILAKDVKRAGYAGKWY